MKVGREKKTYSKERLKITRYNLLHDNDKRADWPKCSNQNKEGYNGLEYEIIFHLKPSANTHMIKSKFLVEVWFVTG